MENEKPKSVHKTLIILWSLLLIEVIRSVLMLYSYASQGALTSKFIFYFLWIIGLEALIIFFIAKRKNWARWLYIIFLVIEIPSAISSLDKNPHQKSILGTMELIQIIAYFLVFFFLFSKPVRGWFNDKTDQENGNFTKLKKRTIIISLGVFIVTLPFFGSLYTLIGGLSIRAVHGLIFDGTSDLYSYQIGKEVNLAPLTVITKMTNYGGWKDEYNYIFANNPVGNNEPRINEYRTFKVIDEKTQTSLLDTTKKICIIEDIKNKNLQASINCEDIPHINEATKTYAEIDREIKTKGKAFVATTADRRNSKLKSILKINSFIVFEINNEKELKELIAPEVEGNDSYEYIMRLTHLIPLKEDEVFEEHAQSKIFIHYFGGQWSEELYRYSSFESYIQNNITSPDMEKWIMENHSNPRDRWAIRSILSIVQQAIYIEEKMDSYRATEFVKGLEQSKECVAKYYSTPGNAKNAIDKALEKFFEKTDRRKAYERIKDKFGSQYGADPKPCHHFFPPVVCGGDEKCESWTR